MKGPALKQARPIVLPLDVTTTVDPTISWKLLNPYGIQTTAPPVTDPLGGVWHAGHVNDVLILQAPSASAGSLLLGSDSGGVWIVYSNKVRPETVCLSDDWDTPGIQCLCPGPGGPEHIFAGTSDVLFGNQTGYVYETVPLAAGGNFSVTKWRPIPNGSGALTNFGTVFRIVVVDGPTPRIAIATNLGVFWAEIPATGGNYAWQQASKMSDGTTFPVGAYSGLALGPNQSVIVAAYGVNAGQGLYGIFYGDWSTGALVMTRATLPPGPANSPVPFSRGMYRTSLSSCAGNLQRVYAVSAGSDAKMYCILRSEDGGKTWDLPYDPSGTNAEFPIVTSTGKSLFDAAGGQGTYNNVIAVSPVDLAGKTVLVGWQNGTFLSTDSGVNWNHLSAAELHADVHVLYFDPSDTSGKTFLIGSDGGVAVTKDFGKSFDSSANKYLAQLQFYSTTAMRDFYGTISISPPLPAGGDYLGPILAAGSQDNGNLFCIVEGSYSNSSGSPQKAPSPWMPFTGCDGGTVAYLPNGQVVYTKHCGGPTIIDYQTLAAELPWKHGPETQVLINDPGKPDNGKNLAGRVEAVRSVPKIADTAGNPMYAVAFSGENVYGVFASPGGGNVYLRQLGSVPSITGESIWAVGSYDGSFILLGTNHGRMFSLTPSLGTLVTGESVPVTLPPQVPQGTIGRIVPVSNTHAFATYYYFGWEGRVLGFDGTSWTPADSGLPSDASQGLEVEDSGTILFAATAAQVFVSRDSGTSWSIASTGLPRQPHCSDLRFNRDLNGAGFLYLSTFGRSVWRCRAGIIKVPDLTNLTLPYATQELTNLGLVVQHVTTTGPPPGPGILPAIVIGQNPLPGTVVGPGTGVDLSLQRQHAPRQ